MPCLYHVSVQMYFKRKSQSRFADILWKYLVHWKLASLFCSCSRKEAPNSESRCLSLHCPESQTHLTTVTSVSPQPSSHICWPAPSSVLSSSSVAATSFSLTHQLARLWKSCWPKEFGARGFGMESSGSTHGSPGGVPEG